MAKNKRDSIDLTETQITYIRVAFEGYDVKKNGRIPVEKLREVMRNLGHNLNQEQLKELQDAVDTDKSGSIEWDEFLVLMANMIKDKEERQHYKNLFRILDKKNKGYIECNDLREILIELSRQVADLTISDVDAMIEDIDENANGQVSFDEFYKLMTSE